jgi:hypothetical protein
VDHSVSLQACKGHAVVEALQTPGERELVMIDPSTGTDKIVTVPWDSSLVLEPSQVVVRPCGYRLDAQQSMAVQGLRALGLHVEKVTAQHQQSFYIGLDQPWANLGMQALEPGLSNSYTTHGIVKTPQSIQRVMVRKGTAKNGAVSVDHHRVSQRAVNKQRHR